MFYGQRRIAYWVSLFDTLKQSNDFIITINSSLRDSSCLVWYNCCSTAFEGLTTIIHWFLPKWHRNIRLIHSINLVSTSYYLFPWIINVEFDSLLKWMQYILLWYVLCTRSNTKINVREERSHKISCKEMTCCPRKIFVQVQVSKSHAL